MKFLFILLLLFIGGNSWGQELSQIVVKATSDLKNGRKCLPQIGKESIHFCTGVHLSLRDVMQIERKGMPYCTSLIEKRGYRVIFEGKHDQVDKELWNSFYKTTKWAETFHQNKFVFIKKIATKIDCLHELIHTLQWTDINSNSLSPLNRAKRYQNFEYSLLKLSDQIAQFEKEKKIKQAKKLNIKAQKYLSLLKKYSEISSWLDEKDVYYTLYKLCGSQIECSIADRETIIGNLFKIKEKLPWRFGNEISKKAIDMVKKKEDFYLDRVKYWPLGDKEYQLLDSLFNKSWSQLLTFIKNKKIEVFQFKMSQKKVVLDQADLIPNKVLSSLPEPTKKELLFLLNYSKINQGYVLGKFLCSSDQNFIIVTNNTSKGTLIHEFGHYLQSLKNPSYCDALTGQNIIAMAFQRGQIGRKKYEDYVLRYKTLVRMSELEVYKYLSARSEFSELEIANNKIQYLVFKTWLTKMTRNVYKEYTLPSKIHFKTIDQLPRLSILGGSLVFDLGAMDSVIKPQLLFKHFDLKKIKPIKIKNLRNALGQQLEAPLVELEGDLLLEKKKIPHLRWVLANLKLPNIDGVVGLDFLENKNFIIFPQDEIVQVLDTLEKPSGALPLQRDYDGKIKAIEFNCPSGLVVRLDSGSQIEGDLSADAPEKLQCGLLTIEGQFTRDLQNEVLFGREVGLNLGWPWIQKYRQVQVSLKEGWIAFKK